MLESIEAKANKDNRKRNYIGASAIGHQCDTYIWLNFRHAFDEWIDYTSATRFEDGHNSEEIMAKRIIQSGINLDIGSPESQHRINPEFMHFGGHLDGLLEIDGELVIWEHKSSEKASKAQSYADKDMSTALFKFNEVYYAQAQIYMHYKKCKKHITTISNAGTRENAHPKTGQETVWILTEYNETEALRYIERAKRLILADHKPDRVSKNPMKFPCHWGWGGCSAFDSCWRGKLSKPNCRNCGFVEFHLGGIKCTKHDKPMTIDESNEYHECHRYTPSIMEGWDLISTKDGDMVYEKDGFRIINNNNSLEFMDKANDNLIPLIDLL